MENKEVIVFGASGHAKVIIDIIEQTKDCAVRALFDDNVNLHGSIFYGYQVEGGQPLLQANAIWHSHRFVVAIGNNAIRSKVAASIMANGGRLSAALVHPYTQMARGVKVGSGSVVMAGVVINSDARIGNNVIVNTGATIDHDCVIGDAVHIAPGATLCGGIDVGNNSFIGAGAVLSPNLHIGKNVTIGAGATVLSNVEDGMTVVGTPAKSIK